MIFIQTKEEHPLASIANDFANALFTESDKADDFVSQLSKLASQSKYTNYHALVCDQAKAVYALKPEDKRASACAHVASLALFCATQSAEEAEVISAGLIPSTAQFITNNPNLKTEAKFKQLIQLYNTFDTRNHLRYFAFRELLNFSESAKCSQHLSPILSQLDQLVKQWGCTAQEQRDLFVQGSKILRSNGEDFAAFTLLSKYLESFEGTNDKADVEVTKTAVAEAIRLPSVAQLDGFSSFSSVQSLSKSDASLFELLQIFTYKDLKDYNAWQSKNAAVLTKLGLKNEDCVQKMQYLSLCSLAAEKQILKYSEIATALGIKEDQVEEWIIDAIENQRAPSSRQTNLIDVRLDQIEGEVKVLQFTQRSVDDKTWKQIAQKLKQWRESFESAFALQETAFSK